MQLRLVQRVHVAAGREQFLQDLELAATQVAQVRVEGHTLGRIEDGLGLIDSPIAFR